MYAARWASLTHAMQRYMGNYLRHTGSASVNRQMEINRREQITDQQVDGLVQDCSNSSALAVELLQSYTKPSMCNA